MDDGRSKVEAFAPAALPEHKIGFLNDIINHGQIWKIKQD